MQRAAAAVIAFMLARWIGDHPDVFFAPIAAIVSLNTDVGERGFNALKLLLGVVMGIVIGELTQLVVGNQVVALGIAALLAITVATVAGGSRLTIAQAAAAAVLTIAIAGEGNGWDRLVDALVGAGVALLFTQVLFPPNPLRLLRQAETDALSSLAQGLDAAAYAMRHDDAEAGRDALTQLRRTRDHLAEIHNVRQRSRRVTRHTLTRRGSTQPVVAENENAGFLDLLGDGSVMAVRLGLDGDREQQQHLSHPLSVCARLIGSLAAGPGDRVNRQQVVDEVPHLLELLHGLEVVREDSAQAATRITRVLIYDMMRYAGVSAENARQVLEQVVSEAEIPDDGAQVSWFRTVSTGLADGAKSVASRFQRMLRRGAQDHDPPNRG